MKEIIIVIIVLLVTNISLHLLIRHKKSRGFNSDSEIQKFSFANKFFSQGFIPTLIIIVMVADTMLDWIAIYIYFLILTYIANSLFIKNEK